MSSTAVNILAASVMAILLITFELGGLSPANAFFGALAVLALFTAYQFLGQDGATLGQAIHAVFVRPKSEAGGEARQVLSYLTYVGVAATGLLVAVQAVATV